jgi:hypothetical protein
MSKKTEEPTTEKEFGLKNIEIKLVQSIQNGYFNNLSSILSFIALERLAYNVTEQTQFRVEGEKLFIWEVPKVQEAKPDDGVSV